MAIQLSLQDSQPSAAAAAQASPAEPAELSEEQLLAQAMAMSMAPLDADVPAVPPTAPCREGVPSRSPSPDPKRRKNSSPLPSHAPPTPDEFKDMPPLLPEEGVAPDDDADLQRALALSMQDTGGAAAAAPVAPAAAAAGGDDELSRVLALSMETWKTEQARPKGTSGTEFFHYNGLHPPCANGKPVRVVQFTAYLQGQPHDTAAQSELEETNRARKIQVRVSRQLLMAFVVSSLLIVSVLVVSLYRLCSITGLFRATPRHRVRGSFWSCARRMAAWRPKPARPLRANGAAATAICRRLQTGAPTTTRCKQ